MKKNTLLFLSSLIAGTFILISTINGQKLTHSRNTSALTYLYKLNNEEIAKINRSDDELIEVDSSYLHTFVDSYPTDSVYKKKLREGYYLETFSRNNHQLCRYLYVPAFKIKLLNNNTDLCVAVYDEHGQPISNAKVKAGHSRLKYDAATLCYIKRKTNKQGILTVSVGDQTAWYDLARTNNYRPFWYATNSLLYRTPLKYLALPVRYIIHLPIDGVRSLINGHSVGTIYKTEWAFKYPKTIFNNFRTYHPQKLNQGYLVFSKPKYMPGDTVRFKAFVLDKKGRCIQDELAASLYFNRKSIKIQTLKPYRPGGYSGEFILHDSLNLKLDNNYNLLLEKSNKEEVLSGNFRYEQYELNNTRLELSADRTEHFANDSTPLRLYLKGTDDNGLNLQDARAKVVLLTQHTEETFEPFTFVPDTLWSTTLPLKTSGQTTLTLPDSVFPKTNTNVTCNVRMLTTDNKSYTQSLPLKHIYHRIRYEMQVKADSVEFTATENEKELTVAVEVSASDLFGTIKAMGSAVTPFKLALDPSFSTYFLKNGKQLHRFDLNKENSKLSCFTKRDADSIHISVNNPAHIPFNYFIYKKNKEIARGRATALQQAIKARNFQNYYVCLQYLWGGEISSNTYKINRQDKKLAIAVKQPELIYPGKKTTVEIEVRDANQKPVEDVDITAYGLTAKFNSAAPQLPDMSTPMPEKKLINNFKIEAHIENSDSVMIAFNYAKWKEEARLDTIEYYRFLYPGNELYQSSLPAPEGITQFSPYVMTPKGDIDPVYIIYIDNRPVYYSWMSTKSPYSFQISDSIGHQIQLRTLTKAITLRNFHFAKGRKTILSMRNDIDKNDITIQNTSSLLSWYETNIIRKTTFQFQPNEPNKTTTLTDDYFIRILGNNSSYADNTVGPVSGLLYYKQHEGFSLSFENEPGYSCQMFPQLLKARQLTTKEALFNLADVSIDSRIHLTDSVTTQRVVQDLVEKRALYKQINCYYNNPARTTKGFCTLSLTGKLPKSGNKQVIFMLLLSTDKPDLPTIENARATRFCGLKPGDYQFTLFYSDGSYAQSKTIALRTNGTNFLNLSTLNIQPSDSIAKRLYKTVQHLSEGNGSVYKNIKEYHRENNFKFASYQGAGNVVSGYIYDTKGEALIGVSVIVENTQFGTITNIDGHFSFIVPSDVRKLKISYIGFEPLIIDIFKDNLQNIRLKENLSALNEVGVVGYGVLKKSLMTGSVTTVSSALQGKVAGIDVQPGASNQFRIRGNASVQGQEPLYIVDGKVFVGNPNTLDASSIENIEVLKDETASALYGSRAANGVVMITTKGNATKTEQAKLGKGALMSKEFLDEMSNASTLRTRFSDEAYWQPRLRTDKAGKARFEVTFPDDITRWKTVVLAMNGDGQTGQYEGSINSYKPLMAQLAQPNFLIAGDSAALIGKALNYLPDTVKIRTQLECNGALRLSRNHRIADAAIDTIPITAGTDTLTLKYTLTRDDGYADGEQRKLPVFEAGISEVNGQFITLEKDSTLQPLIDPKGSPVQLHAYANDLGLITEETGHVMRYLYYCNEQIASKLKVLLADRSIALYTKGKFRYEGEIEKMIARLLKNRNKEGLWGWWKDCNTHFQFSAHIIGALYRAEQQGFKVAWDKDAIARQMITFLNDSLSGPSAEERLHVLQTLRNGDFVLDYPEQIAKIKTKKLNTAAALRLIELKQSCNLPYDTTLIHRLRSYSILQNLYFSDDHYSSCLMNRDIECTLIAYRILRKEHPEQLASIRRYLWEKKQIYQVWNTYESAQLTETLLPDLMMQSPKWEQPTLTVQGKSERIITHFPVDTVLQVSDRIVLRKTGTGPLYLTTYQRKWNSQPKEKKNTIQVDTRFDNGSTSLLKAGKPVKLIVTLRLTGEANYLMIRVPIPAGCSYGDKTQAFRHEVHREYGLTGTNIYCQYLRKGEYSFEINLVPRFSGRYTLNPAQAELMYFPTFNANNALRSVDIQP